MLLKIFTKRKVTGEFVDTRGGYKEHFYQCDELHTEPRYQSGNLSEVHFLIKCADKEDAVKIDCSTQGYQISTDSGAVLEKYVTK